MKPLPRLYRTWRRRREIARLAGRQVLRALAAANPEAAFVQVGANDGRMMDPLRDTILASRWQGLVVEPVPEFFQRLQATYRGLQRVRPVNAAVAAGEGTSAFYRVREVPGLPPLPAWAQGLGSFRREVILQHTDRIPGIERYLVEMQVPCQSWNSLCGSYGLDAVDLVLTDTEGYDYEILRQIDFQRHRPVVLIYEHHHFDAVTDAACKKLLKERGYGLFREGLDTWAIDSERGDPRYARLLARWPRWVAASPYASVV